ncbi:MAG TPA: hypothetical protein DEB40_10065, partial [Elusimicrobia bacterium]|nr:hypothetical protein [Elusimicrobiota bacterium]
ANQGSYGLTAQASLSAPQVCAVQRNVCKSGCAYSSIQSALDSISPKTLAGHTCIVIKDAQTYNEQVTVQGFTNNGSSLTFMTDSSVLPNHPIVAPNTEASTAAFHVMQTSVNIFNIDVKPAANIQYGVLVSSMRVHVSSVNVDAGDKIWGAGMRLGSWNTISHSSVTAIDAHGFYLSGSTNSAISYSSAANNAASGSKYGLYLNKSSSNTIANCFISSGAYLSGTVSDFNTISQSTLTSDSSIYAFYTDSDSNTLTGSYIAQGQNGGDTVNLDGADYNAISQSTITSA